MHIYIAVRRCDIFYGKYKCKVLFFFPLNDYLNYKTLGDRTSFIIIDDFYESISSVLER